MIGSDRLTELHNNLEQLKGFNSNEDNMLSFEGSQGKFIVNSANKISNNSNNQIGCWS